MSNPLYVERGGELVFPPPFIAEEVQFFGFVVEADRARLRDICDRFLNGPSNSDRFVPALSKVMFVFNRLDNLYAKQSPWRERGTYKEQEAAVWMLVLDRQRMMPFWFHPYMVVDDAYAMAMGREVYGFPKSLGWFAVPDGPDDVRSLSVETTVVRQFGAGVPATRAELMAARADGDASLVSQAVDFSSIEDLTQHLVGELQLDASAFVDAPGADILDQLLRLKVPMVFLKQFRDGSDTTGACFQQVVTSVTRMTGFHGARRLGQAFRIHLGDFASHPIRRDLGLGDGPIEVRVAFWAKFDFEVGPCQPL